MLSFFFCAYDPRSILGTSDLLLGLGSAVLVGNVDVLHLLLVLVETVLHLQTQSLCCFKKNVKYREGEEREREHVCEKPGYDKNKELLQNEILSIIQ